MRIRGRITPGLAVAGALLVGPFARPVCGQVDYTRAERLIGWNLAPLVLGEPTDPDWIANGERFWYRVMAPGGKSFMLVDPAAGVRRPLFDNGRLASAMSMARDTSYDPARLPFDTFEFADDGRAIRFRARGTRFRCDIVAYQCTLPDSAAERPAHHLLSPDARWEAFIHEHDLYIRPASGGDSVRLTTDGEEFYGYGNASARPSEIIRGERSAPWLEWSPDSRRIAVARHDERALPTMPLYSSTSVRPKGYEYRYSLPGDSAVLSFEIHLVDIEAKSKVRVDMPAQPYPMAGLAGLGPDNDWLTVKWAPRSDRFFFTHHVRGRKRVQLMEADLATGRPLRTLARDSAATFVELNLLRNGRPNWFVLANDDVIWFSERDGWGHLYRLGRDGNVKNRITAGPWTVADVLRIDEAAGRIWFTARAREPGANPYYRRLYAASLDGTGLTLLTPEHADHTIEFSPSGRFVVDRYSAPDSAGRTVLRSAADGRVLQTLESMDLSRLAEAGWSPPEVVRVRARDNVTDLWGLVFRPHDLDPSRKYPVIVNIYPGPQIGSVGEWRMELDRRGENHGLAELGFIVVQIDALGTPYRSKAFHDAWWGNMGDNGIPDQITAVQQLAVRYPYMDIERVGIYGHSGGGFSSTGAILRYPDFFKVAVSSSGNHDNRSYGHYWGEQYEGLLVRDSATGRDNYLNQVNASLAANLRGRLFLMHGDMDDNVHPAMTLQVVNALIQANKSFDLLILPDRAHGLNEPYVIRRRWDYFVMHLLGREPPRDFEIRRPAN